jgi:hypothetical protein
MNDADRAQSFLTEYLKGEAEFFSIARNPAGSLAYDGWNLAEESGIPLSVRYWSAPSKESLDIAVCVKALAGDPAARLVVSGDDAGTTESTALEILQGKLASYESFHERYPGYGGFLPWFQAGGEMEPTEDWRGEIPGLDNGEWVWSLMTAEYVLRQQGHNALADGYADYNRRLRQNVVKMFYDEDAGKVRGDVRVVDPESSQSRYETIRFKPGRATYLSGEHGVHEGAMMVLFLTLFGDELPAGAVDTIWNGIAMRRVEHEYGTTWQAFWGPAHRRPSGSTSQSIERLTATGSSSTETVNRSALSE